MERAIALNGWKGIMAVVIALLHFEAFYIGKQIYFTTGYLAVDFFFIVSGFLLVNSLAHKKEISVVDIITNKISKWFPMYFWGIIVLVIFYSFLDIEYLKRTSWHVLIETLMLQRWNSHPVLNLPDWYMSALLLCSFFMIIFIKKYNGFFKYIIVPFSIFFAYPFILNQNGNLDVHYQFYEGINGGTLRGWADMCVGVALYYFTLSEKKIIFNKKVMFIVEMLMLFLMYKFLYKHSKSIFDMIVIIPFSFIISTAYSNKGYINKIISFNVFEKLGNISYSIYINHFFVVIFMKSFITGLDLKTGGAVFLGLTILYSSLVQYFLNQCIIKRGWLFKRKSMV